MAVERVTEAKVLAIGRHYLVPCVFAGSNIGNGWQWTAVTGPEHEDGALIGFPHQHYHHDLRFTGKALYDELSDSGKRSPLGAVVVSQYLDGKGVKWMVRQCKREIPDYPPVPWQLDLERAHAGAKLKPDCRTCPHRGIPLGNIKARDGVLTCPGHGLQFDDATGALRPTTLRDFRRREWP